MKKRTRNITNPDITPLIDVVFLLLIFFMVSTVFKKNELALLLNLPQASEGEALKNQKKNFVIELNTETVAINGKKSSLETISDLLDKIKDKSSPVDLRIDKDVKYNRVIKLLDILKKKNLTNLSLITDS